jgi:hypothetical protein
MEVASCAFEGAVLLQVHPARWSDSCRLRKMRRVRLAYVAYIASGFLDDEVVDLKGGVCLEFEIRRGWLVDEGEDEAYPKLTKEVARPRHVSEIHCNGVTQERDD